MIRTKIILGTFGFIPFGIFATLPWIMGEDLVKSSLFFLAVYGAIILSFLAGMVWGWSYKKLNKLDLFIAIIFSLIGFIIIILAKDYLLSSLILSFISFPLFYLFEKNRNDMFKVLDYQKLRLHLTTAVSGCYLLSFLNFI